MSDRQKPPAFVRGCSMGCMVIFALCFYGVVIAFWIGIDAGYRHDLVLLDHGEEVTATVTEVRENYRRHRRGWRAYYEYQVDGVVYEDSIRNSGSDPNYTVGDTIAMLYDPAEPSYAKKASGITREHIERWRTISYVAMTVFTLAAVAGTVLSIRRMRKNGTFSVRIRP